MLCDRPYIKTPAGIKRLDTVLSMEARLAATPFPCGRCLHCLINASRVWQCRLLLEQLVHEKSCFVTLTYNDEAIPDGWNLSKQDVQLFLKRLRKAFAPFKLRYYAVGEYGDNTLRPHYHLAVYGIGSEASRAIDKAWGHGFTYCGDLTKDSASYICGYIQKKWTKRADPALADRVREFSLMSRKPGIGKEAIDEIARKLGKSPHFKKRAIREVYFGKKSMPLGRYLSRALSECLGTGCEISDSFYHYQNELFDLGLSPGKVLLDEVLKASRGKRIRQKRLTKILRKKRKL